MPGLFFSSFLFLARFELFGRQRWRCQRTESINEWVREREREKTIEIEKELHNFSCCWCGEFPLELSREAHCSHARTHTPGSFCISSVSLILFIRLRLAYFGLFSCNFLFVTCKLAEYRRRKVGAMETGGDCWGLSYSVGSLDGNQPKINTTKTKKTTRREKRKRKSYSTNDDSRGRVIVWISYAFFVIASYLQAIFCKIFQLR